MTIPFCIPVPSPFGPPVLFMQGMPQGPKVLAPSRAQR
jgi:hypothetical protein